LSESRAFRDWIDSWIFSSKVLLFDALSVMIEGRNQQFYVAEASQEERY
jgi:hypothetical protein